MNPKTKPTTLIPVANAPCSWGVLEFDMPGKALGYAQVLDEIKATGYTGTELGDWGFMPTDPAKLRDELQARGLALLGAFVPVAFARESAHADGEERAVKTARLMAEAMGTLPFIVLADENGKDTTRPERNSPGASNPSIACRSRSGRRSARGWTGWRKRSAARPDYAACSIIMAPALPRPLGKSSN